jgi:hypothetical protein
LSSIALMIIHNAYAWFHNKKAPFFSIYTREDLKPTITINEHKQYGSLPVRNLE